MASRDWWTETVDSLGAQANFEWKPTSDGHVFNEATKLVKSQTVRCFNHFENHSVISNKASLCKTLKKCGFDQFLPPTYVFDSTSPNFKGDLRAFVQEFESKTNKFPKVFDRGSNIWIIKPSEFSRGSGVELVKTRQDCLNVIDSYLSGYQLCNFDAHQYSEQNSPKKHYLGNTATERKGIWEVTQPEYEQNSKTKLSVVMLEFPSQKLPILPENSYLKALKLKAAPQARKYLHLIRPAKHVVTNFVVQKYLEDPFLYNSRKFDLRVFIFISHELECFIFP